MNYFSLEKYYLLGGIVLIAGIIFWIYSLKNDISKLELQNKNLITEKSVLESNNKTLEDTIKEAQTEYEKNLNKCNALNKIISDSQKVKKDKTNEVVKSNSNDLINLFNSRMLNVQNNS